ncbi:hypothetical protein BDZ91DRAFT_745388 [Kalaharituber pfeilii]|nr:hypothetical protein BDZ91DRAFT_745388 [Kalaharituber pfeilii]
MCVICTIFNLGTTGTAAFTFGNPTSVNTFFINCSDLEFTGKLGPVSINIRQLSSSLKSHDPPGVDVQLISTTLESPLRASRTVICA